MLVLSRQIGESIIIQGDIKVTILGISGEKIRIGIEAPSNVGIVRQELWLKTDRNSYEEKEES